MCNKQTVVNVNTIIVHLSLVFSFELKKHVNIVSSSRYLTVSQYRPTINEC